MNLCLSYPTLSDTDKQLINNFRKTHDKAYVDVVDAHWTMIFPSSCEGIAEERLTQHIKAITSKHSRIDFVARYALVYDDDSSDTYYIFLVPDEGFSQISRLHDALYSGFMRSKLRLDIPFIPHIGIATSNDRDHLYDLAQKWNKAGYTIKGSIDALTLCSYDGQKVRDITNFNLTK